MRKLLPILFFFTISISLIIAQEKEERITITGDSLVGKLINNENIREVIGNVVLKQGGVTITCNKAIQYLSKNEAQLIGNVVAVEDSTTIITEEAFYSGKFKFAFSNSGVKLNDGKVDLTADNGYYYFNEDRAYFYNNVKLKDSINTLTSQRLNYYEDENKAVATLNVQINDTSSTIYADSLIHFRETETTFAFNNVEIINKNNEVNITGEYLENLGREKYSKITGNPLLTQIDTSDTGKIDTLLITAQVMEAFSDSTNKLIARDSVKIVRGSFSAINNYSIYYKGEDRFFTYKLTEERGQPLVWYEDSQIIGDSIYVYLKDDELDWINIIGNAFLLSKNEGYEFRFNQVSGSNIKLYFKNEDLTRTNVNGNLLSIYYMYENEEPNGLVQSSSDKADLLFEDGKISSVKLYGTPESEFHPEPVILGKEKDFTLPSFIIFNNRPTKEQILKTKK
ncbi:MAG: hypothetical protein A2068_10085 [Ignavibacteria bacterium GWB2_35_6b]|nr:MAG: hypothetical protein A2068_10085 [Ignavibacteria bacterium GWB2_35_6b]